MVLSQIISSQLCKMASTWLTLPCNQDELNSFEGACGFCRKRTVFSPLVSVPTRVGGKGWVSSWAVSGDRKDS